jgi:transcriptional regulator with AAA-type ATPase domain
MGDEMKKDIIVQDFFDNRGVDLSGLGDALKQYTIFMNDHREEFEFIFDILGTDAQKQKEKIEERFIKMNDAEQLVYAMGYKDAGDYYIEIIHKLIDERRCFHTDVISTQSNGAGERDRIKTALNKHGGNVRKTAEYLQMSHTWLYKKIIKHKIRV